MIKSPNKSAVIMGVTGQDGSYLSEFLLAEGYEVVGVKRRSSTDTTIRLAGILDNKKFHLIEGDITDYASVSGVFTQAHSIFGGAPHEFYNLAAQSHVGTSFKQPLATWDSTALGVLNILEVMRQHDYIPTTHFYQASTSEMFGDNYEEQKIGTTIQKVQTENTPFNPRSPYAVAKVAAHQAVNLYRDAYGLFGCCGVLFNHESPQRGENFVTRKITMYVAQLHAAQIRGETLPKLRLGNLDAYRDWGHAADYVRSMHMMLNHTVSDDYIIATGESHSVRDLCKCAFDYIGCDYNYWVVVDPEFFRPSEVPHLHGIADKAKIILGWEPQITFKELVQDMVDADIDAIRPATLSLLNYNPDKPE